MILNPEKDPDSDNIVNIDGSENVEWIVGQADIFLPFSSEIAFDTFSDFPRQPEWSPLLSKVEYLEETSSIDECVGKETKWYVKVAGIRSSWKAVSTCLDRPKEIRWKSISGVRNEGSVSFIKKGENTCVMTLEMKMVAPKVVRFLFSSTFIENKLLPGILVRFRAVVQDDLKTTESMNKYQ